MNCLKSWLEFHLYMLRERWHEFKAYRRLTKEAGGRAIRKTQVFHSPDNVVTLVAEYEDTSGIWISSDNDGVRHTSIPRNNGERNY